jgi:hypothetical protein
MNLTQELAETVARNITSTNDVAKTHFAETMLHELDNLPPEKLNHIANLFNSIFEITEYSPMIVIAIIEACAITKTVAQETLHIESMVERKTTQHKLNLEYGTDAFEFAFYLYAHTINKVIHLISKRDTTSSSDVGGLIDAIFEPLEVRYEET